MKTKRKNVATRQLTLGRPPEIPFELSVLPETGGRSVYADGVVPTTATLDVHRVPLDKMVPTPRLLERQGVKVRCVSEFSLSASCSKSKFEAWFGARLVERSLAEKKYGMSDYRYLALDTRVQPPEVAGLRGLVERVYVQPPPSFFAGERRVPPFWNDKFRLRVLVDVVQILRASSVHRRGVTAKRVRVAMPDTGFYQHPYFVEQGYNFLAVAAPDATDHATDSNGHGTGECANVFVTAPGINFVGVKMGGNVTLAFKTAMELRPAVITNSWGYHVDLPGTTMPNWLKPLHLTVLDAVSKGIVVCFSAGNGHNGFPGSMPEVLSVGGVVVDAGLNYSAAAYTSGFDSTWFPGRSTPDCCGLCGTPPTADYIVLPVEAGASLEKSNGWGAFSGTSAASPMVAGVCALLREVDPVSHRSRCGAC